LVYQKFASKNIFEYIKIEINGERIYLFILFIFYRKKSAVLRVYFADMI